MKKTGNGAMQGVRYGGKNRTNQPPAVEKPNQGEHTGHGDTTGKGRTMSNVHGQWQVGVRTGSMQEGTGRRNTRVV